MSNSYEEDEVFFDSKDHLDSNTVQDEVRSVENGVWFSELRSVEERREIFLSRMGFAENSDLFEPNEANLESFESSAASSYDALLSESRESNSEANCSVDYYSDADWLDDLSIDDANRDIEECVSESSPSVEKRNKKIINWWRHFTRRKTKKNRANEPSKEPKLTPLSVGQSRKRCMELTAVYSGQQLKAHNGLIRTMKFSPDGKYLASGGEDGVVCIWRVATLEASSEADRCGFNRWDVENSYTPRKKKSNPASVIVPEKIFRIEEEPVRKFRGHSSDVLDLAWSESNQLLSSSMDNTVRLWRVGSDECLGVFRHVNYVTCVQFNPTDENYFISGSIDGKVRIWGIRKERVEDWVNVREVVTSVCYQPNGKGFIVGSISGNCRFYESSGGELVLNAEINVKGKNKSSCNKITSIQFLKGNSQRVMITSDDSKIRILDGLDVVCKYKGMAKSGSQISASLTPSGKHIISVGEDSRLYIWNHGDSYVLPLKQKPKSIRSYEHFLPEGNVTVALPWSDSDATSAYDSRGGPHEPLSSSKTRDSDRYSLVSWLSMDGLSRASLTWPEEKLPICDVTSAEQDCVVPCNNEGGEDHHLHYRRQKQLGHGVRAVGPSTWGLVFVTANRDGTIRTFHNYGVPVRS